MQRSTCHLLLWKAGVWKIKSNGVRNCKSVARFYSWRWINNSWEFSRIACVCSYGLPKCQCSRSALVGGFISRAAGFHTHVTKNCFVVVLVTGVKTWFYHWAPIRKVEFMQWKNVDHPTFTRICKSAINWLDYGNSFSGIQTDCLWQTICILEDNYWSVTNAAFACGLVDIGLSWCNTEIERLHRRGGC